MPEVMVQKLPLQVALHLGRQLIAAAGQPGLVLPSEQEICEEYGVSRTVAREAVRILEGLDLVRVSSGRRMELRPPREWDYLNPLLIQMLDPVDVRQILIDLHEVRLLIEPAVTGRAATMLSAEGLARLESCLARMRELEDDPDRYLEQDLLFHMEICWAVGNRVLDRILYSCRWLLAASRKVTNLLWESLAAVTEEHEAIYRALAARDPSAAEAAMRAHLEGNARAWVFEPVVIEQAVQGSKAKMLSSPEAESSVG